PGVLQVIPHHPGEGGLVIHQQNSARVHDASPFCDSPAGSHNVARVPPSDLFSSQIEPRWRPAMVRQTANPRPVPCPAGLVVKNGSNTRINVSRGMPGPVSSISTTATVWPIRSTSELR